MAFNCFAAESTESYSNRQFSANFETELAEQGITIIGGKDTSIEIPSSNRAKPAIVDISWRVGYNTTSGLSSHIKARARNSKVQLATIWGTFRYDDEGSAAAGLYDVTVHGSKPLTNIIYSSFDTKKFFPSGTVVDCEAYGDVDAIQEIMGGDFSFSDVVTVP